MEKKILICYFTVFIILFSFVISFIALTKHSDEEILKIAKDKVQDTNKILIACNVSKEKKQKNNSTKTFNLGRLEIIKTITNEQEVKMLVDLTKSITLDNKDEIKVGGSPACVYQFLDKKSKKILEYDLEKVTLDKINSIYVSNLSENQQKLNEYMHESLEAY